jgi:hypothetical protein
MAVTQVKEINAGRGGKEAYQPDGTTVFNRTRQWRVDTSSATDDDVTVLANTSLPKIGTAHPNHANCKCISRSAKPESNPQKKQWLVLAEYSTKWNIAENPLNDPARTEWSTETFQTIVERDIDGNGVVNSAGDPFDPPAEKDDSRWTSVTRKNVAATVPDWMFAYQDAVNSDSYTIDSIIITAGWAKVSAIHLSEIQERNGTQYRVITVTIHYRAENEDIGSGSGSYGSGSGDDEIEPWHLSLLDAGFRELSGGSSSASASGSGSAGGSLLVNIKDSESDPVTAPVPLDGEGYAIDEPTPENSVFLQFQVYHEKAFQLIESMFT